MGLRPRHPAATKYITRCDYERTHAWWVRISREIGGQRKTTSRTFSDSLFGGKAKAFKAAVEWRDKKLPTLPATKKRERKLGDGYVRKRRLTRRDAKGKTIFYYAWVAWIRLRNGRASATSWSIDKWGTDAARSRARNWLTKTRAADRQGLG